MEITVTIPDELVLQAQAHGLPVETYVERLVEQASRSKAQLAEETEQHRQAVQDMLKFTEMRHFTLGEGVRIKDLLHESHKY